MTELPGLGECNVGDAFVAKDGRRFTVTKADDGRVVMERADNSTVKIAGGINAPFWAHLTRAK